VSLRLPRLILNLRGTHHILSLSLSFLKTFTRFAIFNLFSLLRKVPSTHIIQSCDLWKLLGPPNPSSFCQGGSVGHVESLWYISSCVCQCNTFTGIVTIQPYNQSIVVGTGRYCLDIIPQSICTKMSEFCVAKWSLQPETELSGLTQFMTNIVQWRMSSSPLLLIPLLFSIQTGGNFWKDLKSETSGLNLSSS